MNEQNFRHPIDRRLSGLCASEQRRQRIRERVAAEKMSAEQPVRSVQAAVSFSAKRLALVAALLLLLLLACAAAIAYDWNVLAFLEIRQDAPTAAIVAPVDGKTSNGDLTLGINSAVTDGAYLAFDWTLQKDDPDTPVYIQVESFTANGFPLTTDGTDDFHCQWVPGLFFSGNDQGGNLCRLPEGLTGDSLTVEMVIGLYRPTRPVYQMEVFDETLARQKLDEGYYVIAEGEGFVLELPGEGLIHCFGMVNETTGMSLERTEMAISFTVDAAAGRASHRELPLPGPVHYQNLTMAYTAVSASALQARLSMAVTPEENTREAACRLVETGVFRLTDANGEWLDVVILEGSGGVEQAPDGRWRAVYECSFAQDAELPAQISLSFIVDDQVYAAPLAIKENNGDR